MRRKRLPGNFLVAQGIDCLQVSYLPTCGGLLRVVWRPYLPALALTGMALIVNGLAALQPRPGALSPYAGRPEAELKPEERAAAARAFFERGKGLMEAGTGLWKDYAKLRDADAELREAWRLIAGQDWPAGHEAGLLVRDTPELRALQRQLDHRLRQLQETLGNGGAR